MTGSRAKVAAAIAAVETSLRINPRQVNARFDLGVALLLEDQPRLAVEHFGRALQLNPGDDAARLNLERALAAAGAEGRPRPE